MILRTYFFIAIVCVALGSCAEKVICPAYQSTFIHDKETLRRKFSYFENDTVPKVYTASKTKYLIAVPESYRKRYRKMQTVNMKPVYPMIDDSVLYGFNPVIDSANTLDSAARAGLDSLALAKLDSAKQTKEDSIYVITKDREIRVLKYNYADSLKYDTATGRYLPERAYYYVDEIGYNTEQENYMWYFRKELILPDVRLSKIPDKEKDKSGVDAKKKKSFFQKLMFWKKDKKTDSLKIAPVGTDTLSNATQVQAPEKKSFFKKLMFWKKDTVDPNKQPARKKEEDDVVF